MQVSAKFLPVYCCFVEFKNQNQVHLTLAFFKKAGKEFNYLSSIKKLRHHLLMPEFFLKSLHAMFTWQPTVLFAEVLLHFL